MLTLNFNPHPNVFSEEEEAFIKELVSKVSDACLSCQDCKKCIYSDFCDHLNYDGCRGEPANMLTDFFAVLGVDC